MSTVDIRTIRKREKIRISKELKKIGKPKRWLAETTGFHFNTIYRYLDVKFPGYSPRLIAAADAAIYEYRNPDPKPVPAI